MSSPLLALVESNQLPGNTVDYVFAAAARGVRVVIVTSDPSSVPLGELSQELPAVTVVVADTRSAASVVEVLAGSSGGIAAVHGVCSAHDFYAPVAAEVAAMLGLSGPAPEAVWTCRRKDVQREALHRVGVPQPAFRVCDGSEAAVAAAYELGFPVVVKPVALADSIGVKVCARGTDVSEHVVALTTSDRFSTRRPVPGNLPGRVLVEAVLVGREFAVETLDARAVAVCETVFNFPPGFVEYQYLLRPDNDLRAAGALRSTAEQACAALGLTHGPAHVEMRWDGEEARIVEVNPRLAGGRIPALHRHVHGLDLWSAAVAAALGDEPRGSVKATPKYAAGALRFLRSLRLGAGDVSRLTRLVGDLGPAYDATVLASTRAGTESAPSRTSDVVGWVLNGGPDVSTCVEGLDAVWDRVEREVPLWPGPHDRPGVPG